MVVIDRVQLYRDFSPVLTKLTEASRISAWQLTVTTRWRLTSYYRKCGSASYIVRQWLLWEGERERETPVTSLISRWNREWSCIWLPRRRVNPTLRRVLTLSLSSARTSKCMTCKDKELGAWALDWAAGSSDWWTTMGKWKLCVRWSDCRGSPSSISLACFKQEE